MSTSTINIYKNSLIRPEKNFMVDNISTYLATLTKFTRTEFQYIKHALELEIKIDSDQDNLEFLLANTWDYASIKNSDSSRVVYYFIVNKEWRGQNTIKLSLYMDTLNTFTFGTDYTLSPKTKVMREHKDRFDLFNYYVWENYDSGSYPINPSSATQVSGGMICEQTITFSMTGLPTSKDRWRVSIQPYGLYAIELKDYSVESNGIKIKYFMSFTSVPINRFFDFQLDFIPQIVSMPYLIRRIDYFNEGLNPILYKINEQEIQENSELSTSWNILYKGSASVDCYCVPENPTTTRQKTSPTDLIINLADVTADKYYLIQYGYNETWGWRDGRFFGDPSNIILEAGGTNYTPYGDGSWNYIAEMYGYAYKKPSGQNYFELYQVIQRKNRWTGAWETPIIELITSNVSSITIKNSPDRVYYEEYASIPNDYSLDPVTYWEFTGSTYAIKTLYGINQIDRTDSTLIKIIKSPYAPSKYSFDRIEGLQLDASMWEYDNAYSEFKLISNNGSFSNMIKSNANSFFANLTLPYHELDIGVKKARNIKYESKLYHSSFYQDKFVYDSFSFVFQNEKIDFLKAYQSYIDRNSDDYIPNFTLDFNFTITNTINSKFLFEFPDYKLKMSEEDYDHILPVARNNEEVIYNSQYITYLRTGFNYDLKAKERTEKLAGIQFGLQTGVGAIKSVVATYTSPMGALSWGSYFASTINGITQLTNTIAQAEDSVNRKIASAKAQSVSVAGSDDIDLLMRYSNNKAKLCTYQASDRVRNMLWDLFHYTGYATGEMKVPNLNTRLYFNFVQADIVFYENNANIPQNLMENIKERFVAGLTNLHAVNNEYDFNQEYENFEISLIEAFN